MYWDFDEAGGKKSIYSRSVQMQVVYFMFLFMSVLTHLFIVQTSDQARDQLEFLQSKLDCWLVIDGESLQVCCHSGLHIQMTHSFMIYDFDPIALSEPVQE